MPKGEEDGVKDMEKETIQFHGKTGKVTWIEFEKSIARYFRMKFESEIGNKQQDLEKRIARDRGRGRD